MAERKLPGVAIYEIQARRQDDVYADGDQDVVVIGKIGGDVILAEKRNAAQTSSAKPGSEGCDSYLFPFNSPKDPGWLKQQNHDQDRKGDTVSPLGKPDCDDERLQDTDD